MICRTDESTETYSVRSDSKERPKRDQSWSHLGRKATQKFFSSLNSEDVGLKSIYSSCASHPVTASGPPPPPEIFGTCCLEIPKPMLLYPFV